MELVKVNRVAKDIGIFGKKGFGKTTILSLVGLLEWYIHNTIIYSNYDLLVPHEKINSLKKFDSIPKNNKRKVYLGDDFDFWFKSRVSTSKINLTLDDILIMWGKNNMSLVYSAKREYSIDKSLRESTFEFWEVELRPMYYNPDRKKHNLLKKYLNFLFIQINRFDSDLKPLRPYKVYNLPLIVRLFNTKETIEKLTL